MRLNVLFLSELLHPHGSGAELATYLYAKILSEMEVNVVLVTNRFGKEPEVSKKGNLTVYRLHLFKGIRSTKYSIITRFDVLFSTFLKKLIKWSDIVYVPRFWYSAIPLAKTHGKPVITHLHDYIPICPLATCFNVSKNTVCNHNSLLCSPACIYCFERKHGRGCTESLMSTFLNSTVRRYAYHVLRLSDTVLCVSKKQRDIMVEGVPHLRGKIKVLHNPFLQVPLSDVKGKDFGYFGGPNYLKGFHTLCQALIHMNNATSKTVRVHATKFRKTTRKFAERAKSLGFLLHGKLDTQRFERLYRQIFAVVVPSIWHEPWGYVVIEAILRGRLIIASRTGGIPEQVEGCKGVILCQPGNFVELAETADFVRGFDKEVVEDLGIQNREAFLKRFNNKASATKFVSICEDLL